MNKPVIMSVDDDQVVLRALERDLRAHYQSDYRVLSVNGGREAIEAAVQLKARGSAVALLLVDQKMPELSGTELLVELLKLHPDALKVLLTAYADTEAAITSINQIGLDYYLLKPWDPPEQKLYPVLDDLLVDWAARARVPYDGIRVFGTRLSPQSYAVKEFLSRNHVPYEWADVEQDTSSQELVTRLAGEAAQLPVVVFPDGRHAVAPTSAELASLAGLHTKALQNFYDLVIVGAGPAGLAAGVYGASEGLTTLMVEHDAPGGQAGTSSNIENYLGFPSGVSGLDLARRARDQARRFGAELLSSDVVSVARDDPYRVVRLADGSEVVAYTVVLATGVSVRMLEVPGMDQLLGAGVYYGAALSEAATYRDQDVCVVGAANSAGQGALFFARTARKVTVLCRGPSLAESMSQYLIDRIDGAPNIEVRMGVTVERVRGQSSLEGVVIRDASGAEVELPMAAMFIFIGAAPRTEFVAGLVERDERGYILTGPDLPRARSGPRGWTLTRDPYLLETNVPGIFAAGDVRAGSSKRVAAAVGEGSATVSMVHRYLETV